MSPVRRWSSMQFVTSFAIPEGLHAEALVFEECGVTILASIEDHTGRCPKCERSSHRVRGYYRRTMADLPWAGAPVRFRVRVRKFQCENPRCQRKIFAERLEGLAWCYARRTDRQRKALEEVGFALGGEAGSRLAADLGLPTNPDTLLRYIKHLPHLHSEPVRVLGIDDWSWRKRVRYDAPHDLAKRRYRAPPDQVRARSGTLPSPARGRSPRA